MGRVRVRGDHWGHPGTGVGKIKSAYPQDNVHGLDLPDTMGGSFGGSATNIAHSLSGASAVQRQSGKTKGGI